jgi:hypothetical protein
MDARHKAGHDGDCCIHFDSLSFITNSEIVSERNEHNQRVGDVRP